AALGRPERSEASANTTSPFTPQNLVQRARFAPQLEHTLAGLLLVLLPPCLSSQRVDTQVHGRTVQPAAGIAVLPQGKRLAIELQEHLVCQFLRARTIPR